MKTSLNMFLNYHELELSVKKRIYTDRYHIAIKCREKGYTAALFPDNNYGSVELNRFTIKGPLENVFQILIDNLRSGQWYINIFSIEESFNIDIPDDLYLDDCTNLIFKYYLKYEL